MNLDSGRRSVSPTSSGRSSPVPRASRRAVEDGLFKADKGIRKFATIIERALGSWEISPQEWADYIAFLGRLLKAVQSHPKNAPFLPHSTAVASKLSQCLNPALPSGVHQKALEVYAYIFSAFGPEYLSAHLHEYLPGLSPVLSFASLTVRPALYTLFENHIIVLPAAELRPALKSLILGLLPALEEETAEDFERALAIVQKLQRRFSESDDDSPSETEHNGYFWQCLFLCVVTSAARRQGALNFLARELPKFSTTHQDTAIHDGGADCSAASLSREAEAAISLEPGLVIRCFVAGLCDDQVLVQRGFLDLLVTHMPLHSPVLQDRVEAKDLDRLVSATLQVLLRREMSLNRRLWAWFMGPEPSDSSSNSQTPSPDTERKPSEAFDSTQGSHYFETYGKVTLTRCVQQIFLAEATSPAQKARPFRICLSLMDRWDIAAQLVPSILVPALQSAHLYSLTASPEAVAELLRSASLFFDGVEASLIWSSMNEILRDTLSDRTKDLDHLHLFQWILTNFNIRDEEMLTTHIPMTTLHLLSLLNAQVSSSLPPESWSLAMDSLALLIDALPSTAFERSDEATNGYDEASALARRDKNGEETSSTIIRFYDDAVAASISPRMPISGHTVASLLQGGICSVLEGAVNAQAYERSCQVVQLMLALISRTSHVHPWSLHSLQDAIISTLQSAEGGNAVMLFPFVASIVTLLSALRSVDQLSQNEILAFEPSLTRAVWRSFSSNSPKYHVEAVRSFWQLEDIIAPDDSIKASLLSLTRTTQKSSATVESESEECVRRFMVLWNHTMPGQSPNNKTGAFGLTRRGSAMPTMNDTAQSARRQDLLREPLLLVLDRLCDSTSPEVEAIQAWLSALPSMDLVLSIILDSFSLYAGPNDALGPDNRAVKRQASERKRCLEYYLGHIKNLLSYGGDWVWQCLRTSIIPHGNTSSGVAFLAQTSSDILRSPIKHSMTLHQSAIAVLDKLFTGPDASELGSLDLDVALIDRLMLSLRDEDGALQGPLLRLIVQAINLRLRQASPEQTSATRPQASMNSKMSSTNSEKPDTSKTPLATTIVPPPQLMQCISLGFSSPSARFHSDQWLDFLASVLPTFSDAIFTNLIPLVECFCRELNKGFGNLKAISHVGVGPSMTAPESALLALLEGLEMVLARGHECLIADVMVDSALRQPTPVNGFLGSMTSGVFKVEGPPSRMAQANSRLTVILAFQDAIRVSLVMWIWSTHYTEDPSFDRTSSATTAYCSLRVRNKTRHLLEQMFAVEPLESLEVIMARWRYTPLDDEAAAMINLFQVMQGSRPKNVVPAILDALCSRANPSALSAARQSTQTTDLTALDVTLFLAAYLKSTEDDAMDEVWGDCIAFLRDVLANPLPYRQVLPALLTMILLLAEKLGNTNFGEQRKMRRELGDIFIRVLGATFTTLPSGFAYEPSVPGQALHDKNLGRSPPNLFVVLKDLVMSLDTILETPERTSAAINNITTNVMAVLMHAKSFPKNIDLHSLELLLECAKKAPSSKVWKKEVTDAFGDPRLLLSSATLMKDGWFPILHQWCLRDKDRMPDQLSRLTPPSSAGIMFGVGASAARLEADRKTQLTIRRMCLLLLASPEDAFVLHLKDFEEKLVELFEATYSSSPSSAVKAELFLLCRTLVLSLSPMRLSPMWPVINDNLQSAFTSLLPNAADTKGFTNLSLLQACKLLDQLVAMLPDEFQLHEWLYITDTIDAVYQQSEHSVRALADQVAEALGTDALEDSQPLVPLSSTVSGAQNRRRQLLDSDLSMDTEDLKAMSKDDFARAILRPFLSQLSMHAYEGVYSMESPDLEICRRNILEDVLDLSTIVE